jgi:hypothetical protein
MPGAYVPLLTPGRWPLVLWTMKALDVARFLRNGKARGLALYAALAAKAQASTSKIIRQARLAHAATWSSVAPSLFSLEGLPRRRLSQDNRDVVAAALTARRYALGAFERFGEIVVRRPC